MNDQTTTRDATLAGLTEVEVRRIGDEIRAGGPSLWSLDEIDAELRAREEDEMPLETAIFESEGWSLAALEEPDDEEYEDADEPDEEEIGVGFSGTTDIDGTRFGIPPSPRDRLRTFLRNANVWTDEAWAAVERELDEAFGEEASK